MVLRDDQWERIEPLLSGRASDCGVTGKGSRLFLEAVLWIFRTEAPWHDLPEDRGNCHTVFTRFNSLGFYSLPLAAGIFIRGLKKWRWGIMFGALSAEANFEYLMIDGSITRVHQHGASSKKPGNRSD